ncbi:hypothetical protein ACI093_001563 [Cronobacter turicensis]
MELQFFIKTSFNDASQLCISEINKISSDKQTSFEKSRNTLIINLLEDIQKAPDLWDTRCTYCIERFGDELNAILVEKITHKDNINIIYALLFNFVIEFDIFHDDLTLLFFNLNPDKNKEIFQEFHEFGINNLDEFGDHNKKRMSIAISKQPSLTVKELFKESNIKSYLSFREGQTSFLSKMETIQSEIDEKIKIVEDLDNTLKEQKTAFNFVGLYAGFASLGETKTKELKRIKAFLLFLGFILPIPILWEAYTLLALTNSGEISSHLIKFAPIIPLTLILIYFFRIVLNNFNSVRAQLMQIELRKSLCQFIQNYAEYSKNIRTSEANPLAKFEDIIFSNIMGSDEKTPSTFDGIEQLAGMIKAIKSK